MATWTNTSKTSTTWTNTTVSAPGIAQYEVNIGSTYNILIGGGYKLIIQPSVVGTTWSNVNKS